MLFGPSTAVLLLASLVAPALAAVPPPRLHPRAAAHIAHERSDIPVLDRRHAVEARSPRRPLRARPGQKLVRRTKKRSTCQVPVAVSASDSVTAVSATSTASSVPGNGLAASPASTATSADSSAASKVPGNTSTTTDAASTLTDSDSSSSSSTAKASKTKTSSGSAGALSTSGSMSAPAASSSASGGSGNATSTGMLSQLFPISTKESWTTCTESSSALSLTDAFTPIQFGKLPTIDSAPDGTSAFVGVFPKGTAKLASGQGFNVYTSGAKSGVDITTATEVIMSYSAFFQSGFEYNKGGKMPGLYGGTSLSDAKSCSGGRQDNRDGCFSVRLMWRTSGMGEFYNYLPNTVTPPYCTDGTAGVYCNSDYGDSVGRGAFTWTAGEWTTVAMRIKLNDAGQANGEQELWVNGQSVISITGLTLGTADTKFQGMMCQTFFGGSDDTWASPQDQDIWFKDFSLAIIS